MDGGAFDKRFLAVTGNLSGPERVLSIVPIEFAGISTAQTVAVVLEPVTEACGSGYRAMGDQVVGHQPSDFIPGQQHIA